MKPKSKLLMYLLTTGCLAACSTTNNNTSLNQNDLDHHIVASTNADLIQANSAEQYHQIGLNYRKKNNTDMATIAYQKALQLDSNYTKSMTGLAAIYAEKHLLILAIPLLERAVKLEPSANHFNNLGYAYNLNQQYAEASRVLNQALVLEPNYVQAQKNLELVTLNTNANNEVGNNENVATDKIEPTVENVANNTAPNVITDNNNDIVLQQTQTDNFLTKKDSNIYELNFPIYTANNEVTTVKNSNENLVAQPSLPINNQIIPVAKEAEYHIAVITSGGTNFKHAPIVSKLFDFNNSTTITHKLTNQDQYLEVINGNGVKGIASAVAAELNQRGISQIKLADANRFNKSKSYIQYRTGYRADAVNLNHGLLNRPLLMRNDNLPANVAIRLVLGKDLLG